METCFLNLLLRLFMVVVAGPQNAWTSTESSAVDGTGGTEGDFTEVTAVPKKVFSTGTDFRELITTGGLLQTEKSSTDRKLGTDQNKPISLKTDSWTPDDSMSLSTEPLSSMVMVTTEATTQWEDQTPDTYTALPGSSRLVTEEHMLQDSPDTALMRGDPTDMRTVDLNVSTGKDEMRTDMRTVGLNVHTDSDEVRTERTVGLNVHTDSDEVRTERTVGLNVHTDSDEVRTERRTVSLNVHTDSDEVKTDMRTVGLNVHTDSDEVRTDMRTVGLNVHTDSDEVRTDMRTVGLSVHTDSDEVRTERKTVGLNVHSDSDEVRTERRTVGLNVHTDSDEVRTERRTVGLNIHAENEELRTVGLNVHTDNEELRTDMRTVGLNVHTDSVEVRTDMRTVGLNVHTENDEVRTDMRTVGLNVLAENDEVRTEMRTVGLNVHTDNDEVRTEMRTVGLNVHTDNDEVRTDMRTMGLNVHTDSDEVRTVGLPVHTESTYISSTITRAGERTLLSVTSNSTSTYTEDSNASQSTSWGLVAGVTGSRDHSDRPSSTQADDLDSSSQTHHPTNSSSETEEPGLSPATAPLTGPPSTTKLNITSSVEDSPNSTPPLRVLDNNNTRWQKDSANPSHSSGGETTPAEEEVSSPPPSSSEDQTFNTTQFGRSSSNNIGTSTHSSPGDPGTQSQGRTEAMTSQTAGAEETTRLGLTTTPPRGRDGVTSVDDSLSRFLSGQPPFTPDTPRLGLVTEAQATTPSTSTHRTQVPEVDEETHRATAAAETTPTPPLVTTWTVELPNSSTHLDAHTQRTTPSPTTGSSLGQQTSASSSQHQGGSGTQTQTQTQTTSTGESPTDTAMRHPETTTATPDSHTAHSSHTPAFSAKSTPTRSTLAHITSASRSTERGTTEVGVTTAQMDDRSTPTAGRACSPSPCVNGGMCVTHGETHFTCHCPQAWTGLTCSDDVDECQNDPCPLVSRCVNTRGSFSCECPLGLDLEDGRTCTKAKTFLGIFSVNNPRFDPLLSRSTTLHEIQREILQLLNASLSILHGYSRSTLSKREEEGLRISAVNMFSPSTDVTSSQVYHSIQMSLNNCSSASAHCQVVLHHQLSYHEESLCLAQKVLCDKERSDCTDSSGAAYCRCRPGYFKLNPEDMSCIECGDGSKLENGTCVRCTFGFGGFNCSNFYKLIAVVVSPAGGALLLILIIALIVTCCKKDKNDINKIIFKSGDFQMSPYAEFPKSNPRVSMEWGREAIEMQENGSTKNLLQMTDIYYSPALRNSDLERNGLYPFSGLPGSRHSCIYPAQWNPSFISDDSRRRDYF